MILSLEAPMLQRAVVALRSEIFSGPFETIAFLLGIANIVLLIRRSIWNYPVGIAMVSIYAWVFFKAHLYSDALLQPFFFVVQFVGWYQWLQHREPDGDLIVESSSTRDRVLYFAATAAGALLLGSAMKRWTSASFPFWDASVAAASVVAQLLLTWRRIENWLWWIGANCISIVVYPLKGLYLSSALYVFFMIMSSLGFVAWRKRLRIQRSLA